jgi:hypothetical protein
MQGSLQEALPVMLENGKYKKACRKNNDRPPRFSFAITEVRQFLLNMHRFHCHFPLTFHSNRRNPLHHSDQDPLLMEPHTPQYFLDDSSSSLPFIF